MPRIFLGNVDITVYWQFMDDNTINIGLKTLDQGWVGIGFNKIMKNTDMVIIQKQNSSALQAVGYFSKGQSMPQKSESQNVKLIDQSFDMLYQYVIFNRITGFLNQEEGNQLEKNKKYEFIVAYSENPNFDFHHESFGSFTVELVQNQTQIQLAQLTKKYRGVKQDVLYNHKRIIFNCWAWGVDVGILFVRYFRGMRYYIQVHQYALTFICAATIFLEFVVTFENFNRIFLINDVWVLFHLLMGLFFMCMLILQIKFGLSLKENLRKNENCLTFTKKIKKKHQILGIILYICGKFQVMTGKYSSQWRKGNPQDYVQQYLTDAAMFLLTVVIIRILIEIFYQMKSFKLIQCLKIFFKYYFRIGHNKNEIQNLIDLSQNKEDVSLINDQFENYQYCFFENKILVLNKFEHPGGNFIINQIKGRDIERFIYGGYNLELLYTPSNPNPTMHEHSEYSEIFFEKYCYGNMPINDRILIQQQPLESQVELNKENSNQLNNWQMCESESISENIGLFKFKNYNYSCATEIKNIKDFGLHFSLRLTNQKQKRLYSLIACYSEENIKHRKKLMDTFFNLNPSARFDIQKQQNEDQEKIRPTNRPRNFMIEDNYSQFLYFIIKNYQHEKSLSAKIHSVTNQQNNYYIEGPFGQGMMLNNEMKGDIIIFAGGTGILPFLDFFDFLLKKLMAQRAKLQSSINYQYWGETMLNEINVYLYASFDFVQNFIGQDIIMNLAQIDKKKRFIPFINFSQDSLTNIQQLQAQNSDQDNNNFIEIEYQIRYDDESFINKQMKKWNDIQKVYICGTPSMNKAVNSALLKQHIKQDLIHYI